MLLSPLQSYRTRASYKLEDPFIREVKEILIRNRLNPDDFYIEKVVKDGVPHLVLTGSVHELYCKNVNKALSDLRNERKSLLLVGINFLDNSSD